MHVMTGRSLFACLMLMEMLARRAQPYQHLNLKPRPQNLLRLLCSIMTTATAYSRWLSVHPADSGYCYEVAAKVSPVVTRTKVARAAHFACQPPLHIFEAAAPLCIPSELMFLL